MSELSSTLLTDLALVILIGASIVPLGNYMAKVFQSQKVGWFEKRFYKTIGIDPRSSQSWKSYAASLLSFSGISVLFLYGILRLQQYLPWAEGFKGMSPALAWNTTISFVTNTNWQNYSGQSTLGFFAQMAGLAVQNFVSAAAGIVVAISLVRAFNARHGETLGNFWVDMYRTIFKILLPFSFIATVILMINGAIQNFNSVKVLHTLTGGLQHLPGGPVASQEAIKELGTNGGGFFNANSAHPFENPSGFTNLLEIYLLLVIGFALPWTMGKLLNNKKQGLAILAAMVGIFVLSTAATTALELHHSGTALSVAGSSMEGKESRFGVGASALFATATTSTSTGAIDAAHESFTPLAGGVLLLNMMFGEISPGGTGSGLYGMLILALMTVFLCGLMVGRTPEFLGKKIQAKEIKFVSLYILTTPLVVLVEAGIAFSNSGVRKSISAAGSHGLSELLYAFTSAGNNNGSAFAGLSANTPFLNIALGLAMALGRFIPMLFVLGLAGSIAKQGHIPEGKGTLSTRNGLFVGLLITVAVVVVALTYIPALALGPLAEGLR
jgi:K+-transporting ATPase ATPase A chain